MAPQSYFRIIELARNKTLLDDIPADLQEPLSEFVRADFVGVEAETMRDPKRLYLQPEGARLWLELIGSGEQATGAMSTGTTSDNESPFGRPADAGDPTAYAPASELTDRDQFPTIKAINKALEDNPWIRKRRPIGKGTGQPVPNRLEIHIGDWHRLKKQRRSMDPLDRPAEIVDAVLEAAGRQAEIRRLRGEK